MERIMKGRSVSTEVKRGIRNSIILPILSYASGTWTWNASQKSIIRAVEISCIRGASGVSGRDGESNESVNERFGISVTAKGVKCGGVEWVKCGALRWFRHVTTPPRGGNHQKKKIYNQQNKTSI